MPCHQLYLVLRANISYYMDSACQSILDDRIRGYENKRKLRDLARIDRNRRFSWSKIQRTIVTLCCVGSTGGFFYLPLYTTIRHKGIFIIRWCNTISSIHDKLVNSPRSGARLLFLVLSGASKNSYPKRSLLSLRKNCVINTRMSGASANNQFTNSSPPQLSLSSLTSSLVLIQVLLAIPPTMTPLSILRMP